MAVLTNQTEPALIRGIRAIGVGKRGSKPLDPGLVTEILEDLRSGTLSPASKGAFFAALVLKGVLPHERALEKALFPGAFENLGGLTDALAPNAPPFVKDICSDILSGKTLDKESAYRLGKFLFSTDPGDGARGLVASALRVRYETADEYEGILGAMQDTLEKPFREKVPDGDPVIQLAEPFDGVDNSYLITPLIADYIQTLGFRTVSLTGRNSGPKWGNTLLDLIKCMGIAPIEKNTDLGCPKPDFGWYINQENLSRAVDRWVEIRRHTVKRPFLSTLEKFLNPVNAQVVIASAFHPPYTEKMAAIAERAGFPAAIILRNGLEGGLAFPLNRSVKAICTSFQCEGEYSHEEAEIHPSEFLGKETAVDEKLSDPSLEENARLVKTYKEKGATGNRLFDDRVKVTCLGIKRLLGVIKRNLSL